MATRATSPICKNCGLERLICDIAIFAQNDRDIKIEGSDADFTDEFIEDEEK